MFAQMMAASGGGNSEVYAVLIAHKVNNEAKVYTGVTDPSQNDGVYWSGNTSADDVHTTGGYGGNFDFTITVSSTISLRFYSGTYSTRYFDVDLIKNGITIETTRISLDSSLNATWSRLLVVS